MKGIAFVLLGVSSLVSCTSPSEPSKSLSVESAGGPAVSGSQASPANKAGGKDSGGKSAAEKRAFEIADLYRCATVSAPSLSKDGARIAFAVKRYELEAGKTWSEIWMCAADGTGLRQMTSGDHNDTDARFSPDGKLLLFASDRSGAGQIWTMAIDGGEPKQLTKFGPGVSGAEWSPDGKHIAVTADLFLDCGIDEDCNKKVADGREEGKLKVHVTDELLYRHWTGWRDGARTHILLVDAESGKVVKDMTPGRWDSPTFSLGGRGFAFSPDGKELCYVSNHDADEASSTNADLWVVPVEGEITETTAVNVTSGNKGWDGAPLYSPDGKWIAYVSQETPGYESALKRLAVYDREKKARGFIVDRRNFRDWVNDMRWTGDSKALVFQADYLGRNPLFKIAIEGGRPEGIMEHAFIAGFELTPAGDEVIYTRRSIHEPTEVFRSKFDRTETTVSQSGPKAGPTKSDSESSIQGFIRTTSRLTSQSPSERTRLTTFNASIESEVDIRPPEELWIPGDGDYKVHCYVVKPHGFDAAKKYPLILNVHGGPQSQWEDAFRGDWQVYPGKGYIVAFCNPTGSTGYGQDFTDAIAGDWGGRVYRDLMKVTDELEKLAYVDKNKIGVMGWSYGGYMAMWMQGHTTRYDCIASMMGVYNLEAEYGATEELWFPEHDFKGMPWTSEDYAKWSPNKFVKNFKTPALVITGEKDYRVPYTQSLEYYTGLKKMGVPARLIVYPNAGHWPSWYEMAFYYNAHLEFFHEHLGGEPAPWKVSEFANNLAFEKKDKEKQEAEKGIN